MRKALTIYAANLERDSSEALLAARNYKIVLKAMRRSDPDIETALRKILDSDSEN